MPYLYTSKAAVTLATREAAYVRLGNLVRQLHAFNVNLTSIVRRADNFVEVTVNVQLPAHKLEQLGLDGPVLV
ncbi:MAG: hypothetical protein H0U12_07100 [Thermoleophilaceae bacterium]|nr:hypothetical protein [Thermoleophilaceae bacterium]